MDRIDMRQAKGAGNGEWLTRQRTLNLVLAAVTAIVLYLCYAMTAPFIAPLTWALALAVVTHPLHAWVRKRLRRESIAAGLAVLVVTAVLIGPAVFVAQQIATEGAAAIEQVEKGVAQGRSKQAIEKNPRLESSLAWVAEKANLAQEVKQASQSLSEKLGSIVAGTVAIATGILITLFLLFYFFRDGQELIKSLRGLVPLSERESTEVFHRVHDTIGGIVYGTLIVALLQGALGGLMFWWLGLPGPILWGAVMAVLAVLPFFGAAIVWVPAAVFLALEGDWTKALILTGWGSIVVALIDNLLYPLLVKDRLQLHTVPVFISIVGGLAFFGAAGIVLGPVVLAVAVVLLDIWRRRIAHRGAAENVVEAGVRTRS